MAKVPHHADKFELGTFLFSFFVFTSLFVGWRLSNYHLMTPLHGTGYMLGIGGGVMMLLLLLYPLQKRIQSRKRLITLRSWFQFHMALGVLGPLLIMYHCNFHLGDTNSNIALYTMLVVAGSGVFGRYFYSRIHRGLYGKKESIAELQKELKSEESDLAIVLKHYPDVQTQLVGFIQKYTKSGRSVSGNFIKALGARARVGKMRRHIRELARQAVTQQARAQKWNNAQTKEVLNGIHASLDETFSLTLKIAQFNMFERLFGLWHVMHIPLFFIMLTAIIVHIATAHLY